jgi:hypothetical protein
MKRLPTIVVPSIAIIAVLIGGYGTGYMCLSKLQAGSITYSESFDPLVEEPSYSVRSFPCRWMAIAFQPAANVESSIRKHTVNLEPSGGPEMRVLPGCSSIQTVLLR